MNVLSKAVFCSLAFTGVGSLIHFLFFEKEVEKDKYGHLPIITIKSVSTEILLPNYKIGCIMGRGGDKIRYIQWSTCTKVFFRDVNYFQHMKICVVKGTDEAVRDACKLIHEALATHSEVVTLPVYMPLRVCSILLWNRGEKLYWLRNVSKAKITFDKWSFHNQYGTRKLYVRGTQAQIQRVKSFIKNCMRDDNMLHPISILPSPSPMNWQDLSIPLLDDFLDDAPPNIENMLITGNNGILEVFITAIETPEKFWIQVMGPNIVLWENLCEEMTHFYEKSRNRKARKLENVTVGMVVAALREWDRKWYRGEITNVVNITGRNPRTEVEVFYVDFGEVARVKKKDVLQLEQKFLSMRYQAIECVMAHVFPNGGTWSGKSIKFFKDITCRGQWRTLNAKVIKYEARTDPRTGGARMPAAHIDLVDSTQRRPLDIAYELVKKGHAVWDFRRSIRSAAASFLNEH